jgi:nucleoside-diphosphate-sugar epimerase
MGASILLTGGSGFVGRAILDQLLADGHNVTAVFRNRKPRHSSPNLALRSLDLLRSTGEELQDLIRESAATHCVHAAWYTNHADYLVSAQNTDWLAASLRLVEAFYAAGGDRFIGLGTCIEYDCQEDGGRLTERTTPLRPNTLYGQSKLALFRSLEARGGDYGWARVFFVYGEGDRAGRLLPSVINKIAAGTTAAADFGGLARDYIHVADLAAMISSLTTGSLQGAVNVATGTATTVADIIRTTADLLGRAELADVNDRCDPAQPRLIVANTSRFEREFGRLQVRSLRQGIEELLVKVRS